MSTLTLPEPFASANAGAHTEYGKRKISWTLAEPGEIARNGYQIAWVEITEREPWKGEPLWVSATRRPPGTEGWSRVRFTDKGREAISGILLPLVARYGFTRLWLDLHRTKHTAGDHAQAIAEAQRVVDWHVACRELTDMHAAGVLDFKPADPKLLAQRYTVPVAAAYGSGRDWEPVMAQAFLDGESVGWITSRGQLVPDRHVLLGANA